MVSVALLITTCILGYFVMKICLAVIKACERVIGIRFRLLKGKQKSKETKEWSKEPQTPGERYKE